MNKQYIYETFVDLVESQHIPKQSHYVISQSINQFISRDVEKCVVQQKYYEGWRNDREVNMSANH